MAHHSNEGLDPALAKLVSEEQRRKDMDRTETMRKHLLSNVGPTGKFPEGKMAPGDQGELAYAVGHRNGKVVIEWGKEISSIGMTGQQAVEMAAALLKHARACSDDVLTLEIG